MSAQYTSLTAAEGCAVRRHIRLLIGRRQTPIILSTAVAISVTMLIRIFTESTFRDGRLPRGWCAASERERQWVDLSFDTVGQHPIAAAG